MAVTSFTTSCGNRDVVRNQVLRLAMGTLVWFTFTSIFEIIEYRSGICSVTKYLSKQKCAAKGYRWKGFDISGMKEIHEKNREILFTQSVTLLFFTRFFKLNLTQKSCFCQIELTFVFIISRFLPNYAHICFDNQLIFTKLCSRLFSLSADLPNYAHISR